MKGEAMMRKRHLEILGYHVLQVSGKIRCVQNENVNLTMKFLQKVFTLQIAQIFLINGHIKLK